MPMPLPELTKKDFDRIVKTLRKKHPKLKIRIFTKKDRLPESNANGEYGYGRLDVAVGYSMRPEGDPNRQPWSWHIGVLAHEYSHYLREQRHSAYYNRKVYRANTIFYSYRRPREERERAMYWILRDEYYTDAGAVDILKEWGVWDHFKQNWWRWAASYNYRIKYYLESGEFITGVDSVIKAPNRKLTFKEIMKPISRKKIRYMRFLVESFPLVKVDKDDE
jgi:hypothetical protein